VADSGASPAVSLDSNKGWNRSNSGFVLLVGAVSILIASPWILPEFMQTILIRACLYAVVAITVDLLWGYTGILTFGQAAFFGIGAYATGLVFTHIGFSPTMALFALLAGIAVSMLIASLVGILSFYPGATPLYATVLSLVLPIVVTQVIFSGGTFTGSSSGLTGYESFNLSIAGWLWLCGGFLLMCTVLARRFVQSDTGRLLIAIRENESRCDYLGINTSRIKILLLVCLSAVSSVAGFLYACYGMVVAPEMAGFQFGTEILIWVALGGRGTILGPVIGTLLIDVSSAYLSGDFPFVWKLFLGLSFVIVIVVMPKGLLPAFIQLVRRGKFTPGPSQQGRLQVAGERRLDGLASQGNLALSVKGVQRRFGSLRVLKDVNFVARHGELLSLVGPNGAGKTTLMRCISDGRERSDGEIFLNDHPIGKLSPFECVKLGIGRKFQTANVFHDLTVFDALAVARTRLDRPSVWERTGMISLPLPAMSIVQTTGLDALLQMPCRLLSHGQKQALELAMVLALEPNILLLDEPTAGLTKPERTEIGRTLNKLAEEHKMCVVLIEHDLDFVCDISSRVIVLHQGEIVLDGSVDEVVHSELVRDIYSGSFGMPEDPADNVKEAS